MSSLGASYSLYPPDSAEQMAARLNAEEEDGWRYAAKHDPSGNGLSFVEVIDEDGNIVGNLP